jgi:hypothetical protein
MENWRGAPISNGGSSIHLPEDEDGGGLGRLQLLERFLFLSPTSLAPGSDDGALTWELARPEGGSSAPYPALTPATPASITTLDSSGSPMGVAMPSAVFLGDDTLFVVFRAIPSGGAVVGTDYGDIRAQLFQDGELIWEEVLLEATSSRGGNRPHVSLAKHVWFTGWMPAMAMDAANSVIKIRNIANAFRVQAAYQTAVFRTDRPDTPATCGSQFNTNSENLVDEADYNLSAVTPGKTWIRFGVAVDVSSAPNFGVGDVTFQLAYRQLGILLPKWTGHLVSTSDTYPIYVPITDWLAALGVVSAEAALGLSSLTGLIQIYPAWRYALASPELPAAWAVLPGAGPYSTDGDTYNTGELAVATAGEMWVQLGLKCVLSSGSNPGQVDITALVGIRSAP